MTESPDRGWKRFLRKGAVPVLLAVLGGGLVSLVLARLLDNAVTERTEAALTLALERLEPDFEAVLAKGADPTEQVLSASRIHGVRVTLIGGDGRVLADSGVAPGRLAQVENHANRPEVKEARETGVGHDRRHSATVAQPFIYDARRLRGGEVLRFAVSEAELVASEAPFRRKLEGVAVGAGLLVGLLLMLFRVRHARELDVVREAVSRAARGERPDRPGPVSEETAAVLGQLGDVAELVKAAGEGRLRELALTRTVFEQAPLGLLVVDPGVHVLSVNPRLREILGLDAGRPEGSPHLLEVVRDRNLLALFEKVLRGGSERETLGLVPAHAPGIRLEVAVLGLPPGAPAGEPSAVGVFREVGG